MAEFKKMTKEEVAALDKKDIVTAVKAGEGEVEGQGLIRCPYCGTLLRVPGNPRFVTCCNCWNTFTAIWF